MKSSPKVNFDDFTNDYNQLLKSKTSFFTSNENYFAEHTVNTVRSLITNKPANILEFGCGIGRNIPYLVKCFPNSRIIGSDITSGVLDVAKINNPEIDFFLEPNLDEKLSKFDLILAIGVFHHIHPELREKNLNNLLNRLNEKGFIVIIEHNPFNYITRKIVKSCPYDEDAILIKPKELINIFKSHGCGYIDLGYYLVFPPLIKSLNAIERIIRKLPIGGKYYLKVSK